MKLTLTDDDGFVLETFYIDDADVKKYSCRDNEQAWQAIRRRIQDDLPVWDSKEECDSAK